MDARRGRLEVIAGCMFSGKTEEMIRRLRRAQYARQSVVVFKPAIDQRYSADQVDSHSGQHIKSFLVERAHDIPGLVGDAQRCAGDLGQHAGGRNLQALAVAPHHRLLGARPEPQGQDPIHQHQLGGRGPQTLQGPQHGPLRYLNLFSTDAQSLKPTMSLYSSKPTPLPAKLVSPFASFSSTPCIVFTECISSEMP